MGIEYGLDRVIAQVFLHQIEGGLGAFHRHQGVVDDPAGVALDEGDVGHVVAPDLIDAVHDLEQAVDVVELGVAPQAGIRGVGRLFIQEGVGVLAPGHLAALRLDLQAVRSRDQAALGVLKLAIVVEIQQRVDLLVRVDGVLGRFLRVRRQPEALRRRAHARQQERQCQYHRQCKVRSVLLRHVITSYNDVLVLSEFAVERLSRPVGR